MISSNELGSGKGLYITHRFFDEKKDFWIGKKICILLSGELNTLWVGTWNNWAILVLEMKFNLSRTQKCSSQHSGPHETLTGLEKADFHLLSIRKDF